MIEELVSCVNNNDPTSSLAGGSLINANKSNEQCSAQCDSADMDRITTYYIFLLRETSALIPVISPL